MARPLRPTWSTRKLPAAGTSAVSLFPAKCAITACHYFLTGCSTGTHGRHISPAPASNKTKILYFVYFGLVASGQISFAGVTAMDMRTVDFCHAEVILNANLHVKQEIMEI